MQVDYQPFIDRVIQKYEGGYGWNKKDAGGPTKYGITWRDLAEHRHQPATSAADWAQRVKDMPLSEAEDIYRTKYAVGVTFDGMLAGEDCCTLDYAVNSGVSRGNLVKYEIYKKYTTSILAADFVNRMCDERLQFMKAIRGGADWAEFGHGWGARVADVRAYSLHLVTVGAPVPTAPDLTKVAQPKATHVPKTAGTATTAGTGGVVIAAHTAGFHWPSVAAIGAAVLAIGVAYEAWAAGAAAKANATVHL